MIVSCNFPSFASQKLVDIDGEPREERIQEVKESEANTKTVKETREGNEANEAMKQKMDMCGHGWRSLRRSPVVCPRCKSPYWSVPRKK